MKNLKINKLEVSSFITQIDQNQIKGGTISLPTLEPCDLTNVVACSPTGTYEKTK